MTDKPKKLSDTARALLTSAAMRDDHVIQLPRLPVAAARQVIRSLLNAGLVEEVPAPIDDVGYAWRTGENGGVLMLRATKLGLAGIAEPEGTSAAPISTGATIEMAVEVAATTGTDAAGAVTAAAPTTLDLVANDASPGQDAQGGLDDANDAATVPASAHATASAESALTMPRRARRADVLRLAAQAVLDTWDKRAESDRETVAVMNGPLAALRTALAARASVPASIDSSHPPRETKQAQVLAMLTRDEGASGPQIAEAMGWARHTVRGFLASLANKGIKVDVLERVRQVGPNRTGAKGSYTVYHVASGSQR
jgi:biotin operon repressor